MAYSRQRVDLAGQRFGRLVVLHKAQTRRRQSRWTALCDCGKKRVVRTTDLRQGATTSCGCKRRESKTIEPLQSNRLWRIWRGIRARAPVNDPRVFEIYRGPGTMDPAWQDFETFCQWAGRTGYGPTLSIDRIDNSVGYWPSNCRWATNLEQQNNRTVNVRIEVGGKSYTLTEAHRAFGACPATIKKRLAQGLSPELAVTPGRLQAGTE